MYFLYSVLASLALLLSSPWWLLRMLTSGKYRAGLGERLGRFPARLQYQARRGPGIWIHAVSVGEVLAVGGLIRELREEYPDHRLVISTTTEAGHQLARTRYGPENVFYFPIDLGFAIRPYLRRLRPELVIMAETEFWPNFIHLARKSGASIAVVNARVSDRSLPGYRRWRGLLKRVLENVDVFLAQTETDRERLIAIGGAPERVEVSGNLKFDVKPHHEAAIGAELECAIQSQGAHPVLVFGSTVEGEEPALLAAFRGVLRAHPKALMMLAPRRP
ncbi:MAG TPA: glycosyltransferase N-terminal domain-containing protein, partial [Terriglobales bacterium]|nr:glycosyltransferase N-terminal domain-containing protein [Terriglobales bacterium]